MTTPKSAAEMLRELDEQATNGPWHADPWPNTSKVLTDDWGRYVAVCECSGHESDAHLIATLRNALPEIAALVSEVEKVKRDGYGNTLDALDALTRKLQEVDGE